MLQFAPAAEPPARRVGRKPEDPIHEAVDREAKALCVADDLPAHARVTAAVMLALGREVAAMPVLDHRSPREIAEHLNGI